MSEIDLRIPPVDRPVQFNEPQLTMASGSLTPHYASRRLTATSGTIFIMGLKGTF